MLYYHICVIIFRSEASLLTHPTLSQSVSTFNFFCYVQNQFNWLMFLKLFLSYFVAFLSVCLSLSYLIYLCCYGLYPCFLSKSSQRFACPSPSHSLAYDISVSLDGFCNEIDVRGLVFNFYHLLFF